MTMKPKASGYIWPSYYLTPKHNLDQYAYLPTYLPHLRTVNTFISTGCSNYWLCTAPVVLYLFCFLTCLMTIFVHTILKTKCFRVFIVFIIYKLHNFQCKYPSLYSYTDERLTILHTVNDRRVECLLYKTVHSFIIHQ
jgi:hypothetical protein